MKRAAEGFVHARLNLGRVMRWLAFVAIAAALLSGCKRDANGQLPAPSGEAIQAKAQAVQGFALIAAYPDQKGEEQLAIALEFSKPLVGTQTFDELIAVTD